MKLSNGSAANSEARSFGLPRSRSGFSLSGAGAPIDPRIDAARADLADVSLAGRVFAPYYVEPRNKRTVASIADLREAPSHDAPRSSQLLHGEGFAVLEVANGWAWGFGLHDHYVGYVDAAALEDAPAPTHIVAARLAPLLAEPRDDAKTIGEWPMGSRFASDISDGFAAIAGGYLRAADVLSLDALADEPITFAERLLDTPYVWGGRSGAGVDCSGLVQLALGFAGIAAPRDSDLQQDDLGRALTAGEAGQRGDLIFFPDHVGMLSDELTLLHATEHWGKVVTEPLANVVARIEPVHDEPIVERRRLMK